MALVALTAWRAGTVPRDVIAGLVCLTGAPLLAALPEELRGTDELAPASCVASWTVALSRHMVALASMLTVACLLAPCAPEPFMTGFVAVSTSPAWCTSAGAADGVALTTVLTVALQHASWTVHTRLAPVLTVHAGEAWWA